MENVEILSWLFVYKKWDELNKQPVKDKGFEESFREYLYKKIEPDEMSDERDMGLGLSYQTLSDTSHELDVVCVKDRDLFIFELKHYEVSNVTKEIIFTFLGKVMDFYLKNADVLSDRKITMFLVTINKNINDSIRKKCIAYGIKLIEPSIMTIETLNHYTRELYQKIPEGDSEIKTKVEKLIANISELKEYCNYSFSNIFRYKNNKIEIDIPLLKINPTETLNKIKEYYNLFETVRQEWKSKRN